MGPETTPPPPQPAPLHNSSPDPDAMASSSPPERPEEPYRGLQWIFVGDDGLRSGWSVALFATLLLLFSFALASALSRAHLMTRRGGNLTPQTGFFTELVGFLAVLGAAAVVALIERRRLLDYNLTGPRRLARFSSGMLTGFVALSALVGALAWGGWLHSGATSLTGSQIAVYAAVWAAVFLMVACVEEGLMRCFLLYTLTRSINFWWAVSLVAVTCLSLFLRARGNGVWGVYAIALLGLLPCLFLHLKKAESAGFWEAAWVTSTFFGYGHTSNNGENWIGIFAAAFIGFVFCVSVRVTGSAWWAIGCHAAWDWGETYFYGTPDSGLVAQGHYLTTTLSGPTVWSGGADGPEGSVLVLPVCLLLLALLMIVYRRGSPVALAVSAANEPAAG